MDTIKAGIIGRGNIGSGLLDRLPKETRVQWQIKFTADNEAVYTAFNDSIGGKEGVPILLKGKSSDPIYYCPKVDIVFLTIPTRDNGEVAREFLKDISSRLRKPIVTCEKGGLGNYWPELCADPSGFSRIKYNASVGGGTMMLKKARSHLDSFTYGFLVILNGTVNAFMDRVGGGYRPDPAIEELRANGYVDPLAPGEQNNVLGVINNEVIGDIPKKVAIFGNHVLGLKLRASDFSTKSLRLDQGGLRFLIENAANYRYFVTFERDGVNEFGYGQDSEIGALLHQADGWTIKGGFRKLSPSLEILRVPGVTNIVVADEGPYGYNIIARGLGAGPGPTVTTMIRDAYDLLGY